MGSSAVNDRANRESSPPESLAPAFAALAEDLRRDDRDRYLTALLAPEEARAGLIALYAFNQEIARIRETVSESLIGRMRLQWWRDRLDDIFAGRPPRHPVAEPLAWAVSRHGLDRALFDAILEAREADMDDAQPDDLAALIAYARATSAPVMQLALQVLGARQGEGADSAAEAALAQALTGLMRALPFQLRGRRLMLPADLCREAGLDAGRLYDRGPGVEPAALARVVGQVAAQAASALAEARRRGVSRRLLPALLPARLAARDLKRLARAGHNPFDSRVLAPDGLRPMVLLWARLTGTF